MEHNVTTSAMSLSLLARNVYCVCFTDRDSQDTLRGELAKAREKFFSGNRKTVRVGSREMIRGFEGKLQGKLSRRSFFWRKSAAHVAGRGRLMLEEAFDQLGGYVVVTRDFRGVIASRIFFDKTLLWLKSEYYEPWDSRSARVIFKPVDADDKIERFDWDSAKMRYRSTMLYPVPYQEGTAEQNLLNARFGEPKLLVSTKEGIFCYCPEKEAQARKAAAEDLKGGTLVILPAWEVKDGALTVEDDSDEADISFPSLEEYALIQPRPAAQLPQEVQPPEEESAGATVPAQAEETPKEEESQPQHATEEPADVAASTQVEETSKEEESQPLHAAGEPADAAASTQVEEPPKEVESQPQHAVEEPAGTAAPTQAEEPPKEEVSQPQHPEEKPAGVAAPAQAEEPPKEEVSQPQHTEEEPTGTAASTQVEEAAPKKAKTQLGSLQDPSVDKILQAARELAAKEPDSPIHLHDPEDPVSRAILYAAREAAKAWQQQALLPQQEPALQEEKTPAKAEEHVETPVPAVQVEETTQEKPDAPVKEPAQEEAPAAPAPQEPADLPPVHGRTQQPSGLTVYEGQFREGQRDGFGVAFYKDGTPSYTGSWKEGKRDGLGVSFRDTDHAVHISRWKNGTPEDFVSLFDKEGNLRYGGRIEKGKKQGPGVSYNTADGTVFVGKWVDGRPTGVGSAFDREGNLVYYGEWKNGQRSGHGTQFDSTGGIVFDGEWKDGKYYNGILYQKLEDLPEEDQQ